MKPTDEGHASVRAIDCLETVRRLWDYLDQELDATRFAEVEAHVRNCAGCREHFVFAQAFLGAVSDAWKETPAGADLRASVVHALEREGFRAP